LQLLGTTLHLSKSGLLTVRAKNPPTIGSMAFIRGRDPIGTIIDVFGPISAPYASIKLRYGLDASQYQNAEVWWEERRFRKGRRHYAKRHF